MLNARGLQPRSTLLPHCLKELFPKSSLRRLNFRSFSGAAVTGAHTVGHRNRKGCWPFLGFPRTASFYCSLRFRRRRSPSEHPHTIANIQRTTQEENDVA